MTLGAALQNYATEGFVRWFVFVSDGFGSFSVSSSYHLPSSYRLSSSYRLPAITVGLAGLVGIPLGGAATARDTVAAVVPVK